MYRVMSIDGGGGSFASMRRERVGRRASYSCYSCCLSSAVNSPERCVGVRGWVSCVVWMWAGMYVWSPPPMECSFGHIPFSRRCEIRWDKRIQLLDTDTQHTARYLDGGWKGGLTGSRTGWCRAAPPSRCQPESGVMMFTPERHLPTSGQHGPAPSGTPPPAQPPPPPQTRRETRSHSARQPHSNGLCSPPKEGPGPGSALRHVDAGPSTKGAVGG